MRRYEITSDLVMFGTEDIIEATLVLIRAECGKSIIMLLELRGSVPCFSNCEFGNRTVFHFSFERIFCDQIVSAIVTAIAAATVGVEASAPSTSSTSSGVLVPVLTIVGVGVSL